jgi:hypothetical protein
VAESDPTSLQTRDIDFESEGVGARQSYARTARDELYMSRLPSRFLSRPTRRTFSVLVFLSVLITTAASAKRIAPKPVPPIIRDGVLYSAPNDNGRIEYVSASDAKTRKKLWDIKIYEPIIDPNLEEDVQWVFITDLRLAGHFLLVQGTFFWLRMNGLDATVST